MLCRAEVPPEHGFVAVSTATRLDLGDSSQRHRVHAITQAARGWSVGEDVAQVGVTSVANGFDALQKRRPIKEIGNHILLYGLGE